MTLYDYESRIVVLNNAMDVLWEFLGNLCFVISIDNQ